MSDYGIDKMTGLIVPHIERIVRKDEIAFPMYCHEGTNYCAKDGRDGKIRANDDFVFFTDSDEIASGIIKLLPSHRDCAEAEWGAKHLLPRTDPVLED